MKNQFLILIIFTSCTTQTEKKIDNINSQLKIEKRYKKVISDSTNELTGEIETLTLDFNAIACTCAQWSESKYSSNPDKKVYYWLEPANEKLIIADKLFNGENIPVQIKVTGQIISEHGFPKVKNLSKVSRDEAGQVFRYTEIEVIKN